MAGRLSFGDENAFMVVSHDRTFLERICTRICDIDNGRLSKYYGSYTEFLKRRHFCARTIYVSTMRSKRNQNRRFHTEEHSRPKAQMARGRQKQLDRMDKLEALEQRKSNRTSVFNAFP